MKNSYIVTIGIGAWLEPRTVLVGDLKQLVNLMQLVDGAGEEYEIFDVTTLPITQDYNDLIQEIINSKKPGDMNFG